MLRYLRSVVLAGLVTACGPVYDTVYHFTPPPTEQGRMCAMQCTHNQNMCGQMCYYQEQSCEANARLQAEEDYRDYVRERRRLNRPIKRDVNRFLNLSQCSRSSCESGCEDNYLNCYQMCGGQVTMTRTCVANCEKEKR